MELEIDTATHRLLRKGEQLQDNDEYWDHHQRRWYWTKCPGLKVGDHGTLLNYRRSKGTGQ